MRAGKRKSAWAAVWSEAISGISQRPSRTVLTMLGTVLGVGCFVAVLGLTATASGQISADFSTQIATSVQVNDAGKTFEEGLVYSFPANAEDLTHGLNGVKACGISWTVESNSIIAARMHTDQPSYPIQLKAASAGYIAAIDPTWLSGMSYNQFQQERALPVVVLGVSVAKQLGISDAGGTVMIDGAQYHVSGILADVAMQPEALAEVLIPITTARQVYGQPSDLSRAGMLIRTDVGAAGQIAVEIAPQLRPDNPSLLAVVPPPEPPRMASAISASMQSLFLVLAGVTVLIGGAAIANTTLVSVMERVPEIGLRRALGAAPRHIVVQFLCETAILGAVSGLLGASLGVLSVIGVALALGWTAVMDMWVVCLAPAVGASIGLLAGIYPALKAGRVDPIWALRR